MQRTMIYWAVGALVFDQLSKLLVVFYLDLRTLLYLEVVPPFLNFAMAWNYGVNFGLFASPHGVQRWLLVFIALFISGLVVVWICRDPPSYLGYIGAGLLVGGALGNALDRVIYGAVADFLNVSCCGINNPFAFNFADVAIFAGALALAFFGAEKKRA